MLGDRCYPQVVQRFVIALVDEIDNASGPGGVLSKGNWVKKRKGKAVGRENDQYGQSIGGEKHWIE